MDYNYYNYNENGGNKSLNKKTILYISIAALVVLLVANIIMFTVISSSLKKLVVQESQKAYDRLNEQMDDKVDEALADRITTTISDRVAENITEDVVNSATLAMQGIVEKQVIENFKREYNLPDNYAGIGVIAAAEVGSVLELTASASGSSSQSSAFILNKDGYVITNAHCVTYEYKIWQTPFLYTTETRVYSDIKANFKGSDTKYSMSVIAYDTNKDLAIIKFDNPPSNLKPIRFGDSALVTLGEEVAAIGNAQGLGTSLTTGVVSNPPQPYKNVKVIQTDTTINPGNSGGPLFNIYGQVIGVVSFKIIESQLNEGLGFAIAAESVISYINQVESQKGINIEYTLES